ncbi:asparagine synthase-related protein [Streptomyces sp. NPDC054863]
MSGRGFPFFVVLPDTEDGEYLTRCHPLDTSAPRKILYASGRPWIVGQWNDRELIRAAVDNIQVVLIGSFSVTVRELENRIARVRRLADMDRLPAEFPGSYHLLAGGDEGVRVQGTASGLRRVFAGRRGEIVLAADRADVLADVLGSALRVSALATRLLQPVCHPLSERTLWSGTEAVAPGDCLLITPQGEGSRTASWWRVPDPVLGLKEGAESVRAALSRAVGVRTARGGPISADLSGGFDSTSLAYLAAGHPVDLTVATAMLPDVLVDDGVWARRAAARLPHAAHVVLEPHEVPPGFTNVAGSLERLDDPSVMVVFRERALAVVRRMAQRGSRLHLSGHGGDHLFLGSPAHWHSVARRNPVRAFRQLRGYRTTFAWEWKDIVQQLLDRRSLSHSLASMDLEPGRPIDISTPRLGWLVHPRVPNWVASYGIDLVREQLAAACDHAVPLAATRGVHAELDSIRMGTRDIAALSQMSGMLGLPLHTPYFDDQVITAALSVRPEHRATPWTYKPLLAAAMRGIVPGECLDRTTKAEGSVDILRGLHEHREELGALWEGSFLGELGLVDESALRNMCRNPQSLELDDGGLAGALSCEMWLLNNRELHSSVRIPRSGR